LNAIVAENGMAGARERTGLTNYSNNIYKPQPRAPDQLSTPQAVAQVLQNLTPRAPGHRRPWPRNRLIAIDQRIATHGSEDIARTVMLMLEGSQRHGGVHPINGWIGGHDKLEGARWAVRELRSRTGRLQHWIYVGDSTNDARMFVFSTRSIGTLK
jgi:hypothetical protein